MNILSPLAETQFVPPFSFQPAFTWWVLVPVMIAVVMMISYLYSAQRSIASAQIVRWLTFIRIALVVLVGLLLLKPVVNWHHTEQTSETLWVVLDQSLSMAQKDTQATPIERLRWADALGMLPADARPSRLDRSVVRLTALHDDLLHLQTATHAGSDERETARLFKEFSIELNGLSDEMASIAGELEKDPRIQTGDASSIASGIRSASGEFSAAVSQAIGTGKSDEASATIPWPKTGAAIQAALTKLIPLSNQTDAEFLNQHGSDQPVRDALEKIAQMRRADIAYEALTGRQRGLPRSIADVMDHQQTRVVTFAGTQQMISTPNNSEIPKAIKAGVEPAGTSTDLAGALRFVADQIGQNDHASVLIVSDGRVNDGGDPTIAAQRLATRGVRIFTLGAGSREVAPDASVDYIDAPEWVFKDDTLKTSALLRLDGLAGQPVKVEFLRGNTVLDSHVVTPTDDHVTDVENFRDKPPEPGVYGYTIRVQQMPKEVVLENNVQNFRVTVKNDKLHIILVQDQPRWEDRYVANYLRRDNRVQLQQVLLEPAHIAGVDAPPKVKASPTNSRDIAQTLPQTAEAWSAFDLIVIGDVPTEYLSTETQQNIAKAVRDRGSALLVIAGQLNMPARYTGTPLAELLPVHLASNWSAVALADHQRHGFRAQVAPEGANLPFSQLDLDEKKNSDYWAAMGLEDNRWYWHSEQTQAKQSASVIWQIAELHGAQNQETDALTSARQRALLATMPVGMGRVMYLASEETWRMRQVNGANLHEKFWGQVIRWVVQSDMPAGGKYVRFGASKPRYLAGDPVIISARVMNEDFTPATGKHFKVVARSVKEKDAATGQVQSGAVISSADAIEAAESPGVYRATLSGLPAGGIEFRLEGDPVDALLNNDPQATQKTLLVDILSGTDLEMRNVNPDPNQLARIAQSGNGVAADVAYADVVGLHIPNSDHPLESIQQIGLFSDPQNSFNRLAHWVFLIVFVTLITTEWIVRKIGGLV